MKRVLVLGRTGMLGHMVLDVLSSAGDIAVEGTHRGSPSDPLYFEVESGVESLLQLIRKRGGYDYLVNCIGVLKGGIDEGEPASVRRAIEVNALFPNRLAEVVTPLGGKVIHVSTNGVFSGSSGEPYLEDAPHDCLDAYGKTKSLGEVSAPDVLTLRCSLIGPDPVHKSGLLEWFLALPEGGEAEGYSDHLWNGVTTLQFAEICKRIILEGRFDELRQESPVFHFCPNKPVSKYELLGMFRAAFRKSVTVRPAPGRGGPVSLVLATRYQGLKDLYEFDRGIESAVAELADYMKAERPKTKRTKR